MPVYGERGLSFTTKSSVLGCGYAATELLLIQNLSADYPMLSDDELACHRILLNGEDRVTSGIASAAGDEE